MFSLLVHDRRARLSKTYSHIRSSTHDGKHVERRRVRDKLRQMVGGNTEYSVNEIFLNDQNCNIVEKE
jgi:hypothetical protein